MSLESDTPPATGAPARLPTGSIPRLPVHRPSAGSSLRPPVHATTPPPPAGAAALPPRKEHSRVPLPVRVFPSAPDSLSPLSPVPNSPPASLPGEPPLPRPDATPGDHPHPGTASHPGTEPALAEGVAQRSPVEPVAVPTPVASPAPVLPSPVMQPKRIIVIDDDESLTFTFKLALESRGHTVETENRGVRAIDAIERFAPDVIFLDIIMPGSDGGEVYTRLRSLPRLASIPVVFLTAMVTRAEARQGVPNERGLRYLSKPASIDDVEKAIALIFGL